MPRSRGSEIPQRQSSRGPHSLRTSSSDTDHAHHRPITDRSPKVGTRRSPSGTSQSDPVNQKKLGTRIADLESQLGQAQTELKNLKEQLSSAEVAKKEVQEKLENKSKNKTKAAANPVDNPVEVLEGTRDSPDEFPDNTQKETDVFEVPVQKFAIDEEKIEQDQPVDVLVEPQSAISEPEKISFDDVALKDEEINSLKAKLEEKENELETLGKENESLKSRLDEKTSNVSSIKEKQEEACLKLSQTEDELEASKIDTAQLKEKLEAVKADKAELEAEMKKMRVQTEQWRKVADAAAAVLAGDVDMHCRIPERRGSMDKHFGSMFEPVSGVYNANFMGSPGMVDESDDGSGKQKGRVLESLETSGKRRAKSENLWILFCLSR